MSMVANVKAESNTVNYGKSRDWGTKLGHVTPKVSPDELIAAIMTCDNDKATGVLSKYGFQAIPGLKMVTGQIAADFFGMEYPVFKNVLRRAIPGFYGSDRLRTVSAQVMDELKSSGVRYGCVEIPRAFKITVCDPDGGICMNFTIPRQGLVCLLSPRMVLALAVFLVTGRVKTNNTPLNVVNALIASDYVGVAENVHEERIKAIAKRMRGEAKDAHMSASSEVSEEFVPEVSEPVVEAPAASEEVEERPKSEQDELIEKLTQAIKEGKVDAVKVDPANVSIDLVKTLVTMMGTLTAVAIVPFFKALMTDCMGDAMRKFFSDMVKVE